MHKLAPICDGDIKASTHVWASLWISIIAGLHMVIVFFVVQPFKMQKNNKCGLTTHTGAQIDQGHLLQHNCVALYLYIKSIPVNPVAEFIDPVREI
jgi:hypothetical protein